MIVGVRSRFVVFSAVMMIGFTLGTARAAVESVSIGTVAPASESSTVSGSAAKVLGSKQFEETQTITDAKLRADAGSLSQWSAKASLSYYGPTLGDLSAPDQPNPDGSVGSYSQAIKGAVSVRYRMSPERAFSAGTGVALNHPFHGMDRVDANNPFLTYDHTMRFGGLQMRTSPGMTISTVPNYTAIAQVGGLTLDNSMVYGLGRSGFALSFDTNLSYWIYSREYRPGSTKKGGDGLAQQYTIAWYPGVKYNFSDRLNVNSSAGFQLYNPRQMGDASTLWNRSVTLRLGLGYAFSRDVYFAPYVQGFTNNRSPEMTTFNVSGVFSVL
ncbi:MAG: hypothetical protein IPJ84_07285 [Bdellovibrionales bacterium]|nr:hypothetical protein [Bdellovibrionales bacterium]